MESNQPMRRTMSRRTPHLFGNGPVVRMNRYSGFPQHFAICRSTNPVQFQVLRIYQDHDSPYESDRFTIENDTLDLTSPMYLDQQQDQEEVSRGDFYTNAYSGRDTPVRVRYEIHGLYLRNEITVLPVVLFDNTRILPDPEFLVVPFNSTANAQPSREDPYAIMNHLHNRNNFSPPRFRDRDRERSRFSMTSPYDTPFRNPISPFLLPDDYDTMFRRAETPPRRSLSRRRSIPDEAYLAAGAGQPRQQPQLQSFTVRALIQAAIKENMTCPISMNPIDAETACVTSCQHIFERDSIQRWFRDNSTCPVCRQESSVCS